MMNRIIAVFAAALLANITQAQTSKFTLNGTVKDKKTGETLIGVAVYVKEISGTGTSSNEYGFYSLTHHKVSTTSSATTLVIKQIRL